MVNDETHNADAEFGKLLYAKDLSFTLWGVILCGAFAGFVVMFGLLLLAFGIKDGALAPILLGPLAMVLAPAAWYFLVFRTRRSRFRFFERGVEHATLEGDCRLAYADVSTFTYNVTRVYINFIYSHTDAMMRFQSASGADVIYHTQDRDSGDQLHMVLHHASTAVGERLARALRGGEAVEWCGGSRLLPDGLELAIPSVFGRPKRLFVPYVRLARVTIDKGRCWLYEVGNDRPVVEKQVLLPNFFPGLMVLSHQTNGRVQPN